MAAETCPRNCGNGTIRKAKQWSATLQPLEAEAASRIKSWLPKLHYPIRIGEHDQTAFSFGLIWDWAGSPATRDARSCSRTRAALLRRAIATARCATSPPAGFSVALPRRGGLHAQGPCRQGIRRWLSAFLPMIPQSPAAWLRPPWSPTAPTRSSPILDGLNLSRSWMLEGIAHGLPGEDPRRRRSCRGAARTRAAALPQVTGEHYEGGHWLGTFAVYLTSGRAH
jgi:hypothetical protein